MHEIPKYLIQFSVYSNLSQNIDIFLFKFGPLPGGHARAALALGGV